MLHSYRRLSRNTAVLAASIGGVMVAFFAWNPLLPLHLRALGASDAEVGAVFSILIFAHTVPSLAGGMLADRFGRKWVALGPGLILAPLYVLAGLATEWHLVAVLLICTNVIGAVQWPAMQAMISESDEETRATAFSLIEVFVLSAAVVGPLVGSLVLPLLGVGGLIVASGVILFPITLIRARELRETHRAPVVREVARAQRQRFKPGVWWIIGANALFTLALGLTAGGPFMAILAHDGWSLTEPQVQQLTALGSLAAFGGVWLGSKADRWGLQRMWPITAIGFAVALVGWGLSPNALLGTGFVMASNVFLEALFIVSETLLAHYTTRDTRSFLFGLCGSIGGFTEAIGPMLGTQLVSLGRLAAPFIAAAAFSLLSWIAILPTRGRATEQAVATYPAE